LILKSKQGSSHWKLHAPFIVLHELREKATLGKAVSYGRSRSFKVIETDTNSQ